MHTFKGFCKQIRYPQWYALLLVNIIHFAGVAVLFFSSVAFLAQIFLSAEKPFLPMETFIALIGGAILFIIAISKFNRITIEYTVSFGTEEIHIEVREKNYAYSLSELSLTDYYYKSKTVLSLLKNQDETFFLLLDKQQNPLNEFLHEKFEAEKIEATGKSHPYGLTVINLKHRGYVSYGNKNGKALSVFQFALLKEWNAPFNPKAYELLVPPMEYNPI